jgi:hypothetical protein
MKKMKMKMCRYSKKEGVVDVMQFTHLIDANPHVSNFDTMATIYGFSHIEIVWFKDWLPIPQIQLEPKLYLYRNRLYNVR